MSPAIARRRATGLVFAAVGFIFALPLTGILVFVMLTPSEQAAGNLLATVLLSLVGAALTAVCALALAWLSPARVTGLFQGVAATLLAYLLYFVFLGILGSDMVGVVATGLQILLTTPATWLFPLVGGIAGWLLGRKIRQKV
jgi:hypothetical protein